MDTIFATASANGRAGIAVIRLSGPKAFETCRRLVGDVPRFRYASLRKISDGCGLVLDVGIVLVFPAKGSFTGEDTVEFQVHGSAAVLKALSDTLRCQQGVRQAQPGEFTRRALENNRLDLTQVEGLADLIAAETEAQRLQALDILSGSIGRMVSVWRDDLVRVAALLAAMIDFSDEDLPADLTGEAIALIGRTMKGLKFEIRGSLASERIRDGFEVAIVGPPNIGKSTLLNALAGRDAAITSEIAGTTRDVIEVRMDLRGFPVTFLDTAGLRQSNDVIERIGIERTRKRAEAADFRVVLVQKWGDPVLVPVRDRDIVLVGKCDQTDDAQFGISGLTGYGIEGLLIKLYERIKSLAATAATVSNSRHSELLQQAYDHLAEARTILNADDAIEIANNEVFSGLRALESLVGKVDTENVLDAVFSSFCLGK